MKTVAQYEVAKNRHYNVLQAQKIVHLTSNQFFLLDQDLVCKRDHKLSITIHIRK